MGFTIQSKCKASPSPSQSESRPSPSQYESRSRPSQFENRPGKSPVECASILLKTSLGHVGCVAAAIPQFALFLDVVEGYPAIVIPWSVPRILYLGLSFTVFLLLIMLMLLLQFESRLRPIEAESNTSPSQSESRMGQSLVGFPLRLFQSSSFICVVMKFILFLIFLGVIAQTLVIVIPWLVHVPDFLYPGSFTLFVLLLFV